MKMKIVNKKKFIKSITTLLASIALIILLVIMAVQLINYPEKYLSTWRYQLYQEIQAGDQEAIEYYQKNYLDKGIELWED